MKRNIFFSLAVFFIVTAFCAVGTRAAACTQIVTNTSDGLNPGPAGSLRAAINFANASSDLDTICFSIPAEGVQRISPLAPLPTITNPVIIDGYTQPRASVNTLAVGDNAVLLIEINGAHSTDAHVSGVAIGAGGTGSTVRGLVINQFTENGISISGASGVTIEGNFVGTNAAGTGAIANARSGVDIRDSSYDLIGGTSLAQRNLVSGNSGPGIDMDNFVPGPGHVLNGSGVTRTLIVGNYVGTDATGTVAIGNVLNNIQIVGSTNNSIGGASAGAGNLISGSAENGIRISDGASGNIIQGNKIGTDATGTAPLGNLGGIEIRGSSNNLVGGTNPGEANMIVNNPNGGVTVAPDTGFPDVNNAIRGNSISSQSGFPIELGQDGPDSNDLCDVDGGSNNHQNYPVITSVSFNGGSVIVNGTLDSTASTTFDLDFFSSVEKKGGDYGQAENYIGSATVTTNGSCGASFTVTFPVAVGQKYISATETDPAGNTSEVSKAFGVTTVGAVSDINPSTPGQSVTFTATVSSDNSIPAGSTVTFMDGATTLGTGTTDGSGIATFATSGLSTGVHSITAVYNGNSSAPLSQTVGTVSTTTTLSSSQNPSADGQSLTFTATVTPATSGSGTPTGTVTFKDGTTVLCPSSVVTYGHAVCITSALVNGSHTITATYGGNATFDPSNATAISQLVYGYVAGGGSFVIGKGNAAVQTSVTFWGAQWASLNSLSGGSAPSSFKGFANQTSSTPAACGGTWATRPGNSPPPPSSVPGYMAVIVASSASQSGSTIGGNTTKIVIVKTNPGYDANPGHAGTGTVVGVICQ